MGLVVYITLGGIAGLLTGLALRRWFRGTDRLVGLSLFLGAIGSVGGFVVAIFLRLKPERTPLAALLGSVSLPIGLYSLGARRPAPSP